MLKKEWLSLLLFGLLAGCGPNNDDDAAASLETAESQDVLSDAPLFKKLPQEDPNLVQAAPYWCDRPDWCDRVESPNETDLMQYCGCTGELENHVSKSTPTSRVASEAERLFQDYYDYKCNCSVTTGFIKTCEEGKRLEFFE